MGSTALTMASIMRDPRTFFTEGSPSQFEFVFSLYDEAVKLKASQKNKKVEEYCKLDKWFQHELPKKIQSRGKNAHLLHEELVKCMKWKLSRGKFIPRIKDLIQMNTPRLVVAETKKAFRALHKKDDISSAIQALCNLKGVGPAMASVMLTAADPTQFGFMAEECLMAIPEIEGIDFTTKELLNFVEQLKSAAKRLNSCGGSGWSAHKVEQTLWAHHVVSENKKDLFEGMPGAGVVQENGVSPISSVEKNGGDPESSSDSTANKENTANSNGNHLPTPFSPAPEEDTNDSIPTSDSPHVASPSQVSEDTNDSSGPKLTNGDSQHTKTTLVDEDTNDSLALSESTCDSIPEESSKISSNNSVKNSLDTSNCDLEEPAAKKVKLAE